MTMLDKIFAEFLVFMAVRERGGELTGVTVNNQRDQTGGDCRKKAAVARISDILQYYLYSLSHFVYEVYFCL